MAGAVDYKVFGERIGRLGMSPRQMELNRRWAVYCCAGYDARSVDWDGTKRADHVEHSAIAQQGFIPPGYYDASGQMSELPLKFRRPSTPYHLGKVIVDRFTGLLFSERRHPRLSSIDPVTDDFADALAERARLWPAMIKARTYGGSTGSVCAGFQFVNGVPVVEVHDPRWVFPEFEDRITLKLASFEKRYMFPRELRDQGTGKWLTTWWWYRRTVNSQSDVLYAPAPVGNGEEPEWIVERQADHGLGYCPAVWAQNIPVDDDVDGEPDIHGVYDILESMDTLLSQAQRGTVANCDPTAVLEGIGDLEIPALRKGSGNAIKLPQGTFRYVEITGSGPTAARELVKELRAYALEVAQCVLEHPDVAAATATEINRRYESMLAKADVLREQYGQRLIAPLMDMMVDAATRANKPRVEGDSIVRYAVTLPPRLVDGKLVDRVPPENPEQVTVQWPGYFDTSLADAQAASQAVTTAKLAGVLDDENAAKFLAPYFRVENADEMLVQAQKESGAAQAAVDSELLDRNRASGEVDEDGEPVRSPAAGAHVPTGIKFFQYEIEGGLVTIDEVRASKGLGPKPGGDGHLTLPEYRAKYASVFAASTLSTSPDAAERMPGVAEATGIEPAPPEETSQYPGKP